MQRFLFGGYAIKPCIQHLLKFSFSSWSVNNRISQQVAMFLNKLNQPEHAKEIRDSRTFYAPSYFREICGRGVAIVALCEAQRCALNTLARGLVWPGMKFCIDFVNSGQDRSISRFWLTKGFLMGYVNKFIWITTANLFLTAWNQMVAKDLHLSTAYKLHLAKFMQSA